MNIRQCFAKDTSKAIEICVKLNESFVYERYYVDKIANLKHELFMLAKKHHLHIQWSGDDKVSPTGNKFIISKGKREVCTFYYRKEARHVQKQISN